MVAYSAAAKKRGHFELRPARYKVGRNSTNDIRLQSSNCSKHHCDLEVNDSEIILRDLVCTSMVRNKFCIFFKKKIYFFYFQSKRGTYVNHTNYKQSRCILSEGDFVGFGCKPLNNLKIIDTNDTKYFVYKIEVGTPSLESVAIDDDDDEIDENIQNNSGLESNNLDQSDLDGHCTDGEDAEDSMHAVDDDDDVKPDIHSLLRYEQLMQNLQDLRVNIKEEVSYLASGYERQINEKTRANNNHPQPITNDIVDLCGDSDDDVFKLNPKKKRQRKASPEPVKLAESTEPAQQSEPTTQYETETTILKLPEHQLQEKTLKEKTKNVIVSRGQQLSSEMLKSKKKKSKHSKKPRLTEPSCSTSRQKEPQEHSLSEQRSDESINRIISAITKWKVNWILDYEKNPLQYQLNVKQLDSSFQDLHTYQR